MQEAFVAIFPPPPVQGLGTVGGFKLYIEDRASLGFEDLYSELQGTLGKGREAPELALAVVKPWAATAQHPSCRKAIR